MFCKNWYSDDEFAYLDDRDLQEVSEKLGFIEEYSAATNNPELSKYYKENGDDGIEEIEIYEPTEDTENLDKEKGNQIFGIPLNFPEWPFHFGGF